MAGEALEFGAAHGEHDSEVAAAVGEEEEEDSGAAGEGEGGVDVG